MGIYFNNVALKKLSGEQFKTLNQLADIAEAENIAEDENNDKEAIKNYLADLAKKEADAATRQQNLVNSFV